ncbi:AAA family ATPase [Streptomyces monticola]|uniref:AAA family ATPase n=1 Tax=Streptomyces monticola TaxID=2666263 RepID=A0ABW2JXN3_9ACTN
MTLVGRTSILNTLETALADCVAGESRTVLVEGAAGCGKSALLDVIAERAAAAGGLVLSADAVPDERDVPLGVLRQLVNSGPELTQPRTTADGGRAASRTEGMQAFCAQLRELAEDTPVLVCVDDVQHADRESLRYLRYVARHARTARVLMVLSVSPYDGVLDPAFATELMRTAAFRRLRVGLLPQDEVAEVVRAHGRPELLDSAHALSGGNPLLLRALLAEYEYESGYETGYESAHGYESGHGYGSGGAPLPGGPLPGGPFAQAVATCLDRSGPGATALARAAAVLGEEAARAGLAELLGTGVPAAARTLAALGAAGIVDGARFRHEATRAAVLDAIEPEPRRELHRRAALLLRRAGRPATAVAGHLLASARDGRLDAPGALEVEILCDAAEDLLAGDDAQGAVRLFELAHEACADEQQRHALQIRLAGITWRFNPAAAERQLSGPLEALRAGRLAAEQRKPLAHLLQFQGRWPEAADLLDPGTDGSDTGATPVDAAIDAGGAAGERLLQSARLSDITLAPIAQALRSLVYSDHPERAVPWSRKLLDEADRAKAPGWSAVLATLHAEALLRLGDLRGAHGYATRAVQILPEKNGSILRYAPTAILVRASSAMGRYTDASRHTDQPVPQRLLTTLHGLGYLRARGLHQLAGNHPQAALADFMEVGRLMESWGVDRPAYLPWRTDAADALLRLGRTQEAERLVLQQLALPDARRPWVRGISLRGRALCTTTAKQRIALLTQATDELHRSGDRLETARAMADLGQALQADGGSLSKGNSMVRTAWNLAQECGAASLCREILPDAPLSGPGRGREPLAPDEEPKKSETRLSSSEQRVATLAAQGLTNREISAKLYLTVSTVEQHLTRVYRKLQISCRGDLPMDLALGTLQSVKQ